jgi:hypothetical protein
MKTWAKFAIGCLALLLLACIILAIIGFFMYKRGSNLFGFLGGAYDTGKNVVSIQKLDQQYPFSPPADGTLQEKRLQAFLGVCQGVKTVAEPLKAGLEQAEQESQGEAAKKVAAATAGITQSMREGLERAKMSPSEFRWISDTAYAALEEASYEGGSAIQGMEGFEAMGRESLKALEPQLDNPNLTAEQREALEGQIAAIKEQLGQGAAPAGEGTSANAALAERYRQQLEDYDIRDVAEMGLGGQSR